MKSIDPRVNRIDIESQDQASIQKGECLATYEVFHQKKSGENYIHVGSLHAANPEMALLLAKEQFARRSRTSNIWVVPSASILTFESEETEIFTTTPEKKHREAAGYRVRDKVNSYKKRLKDE